MTALACLRILADPDRAPVGADRPLPGLRRVVAAYLYGRWSRPRRFGEVTPGAFLLTDPLAAHVDPDDLIALAMELRDEPVSLVLLDGDEAATALLAALNPADLRSMLAGRLTVEGLEGLLTVITCDGVRLVAPEPDRPTPPRLIIDRATGRRPETRTEPLRLAG